MTTPRHRGRLVTSLGLAKGIRSLGLGAVALLVPLVWLSPSTASAAGPSVIISEVSAWGSGNTSYASDWFELTNTGSAAVPITGWRMDDNSNSFASSVPLVGVASIAPGQSVVFTEASVAAAFTAAWFGSNPPPGLTMGTYSGSGVGLSTTGDAVNIYDSSGTLVTGVTFGASVTTTPLRTFDNAAGLTGTISALSSAGVNGAFVAADGIEIGSPGTVTTDPNATTTTTTTTTIPTGPTFLPWPGGATIETASDYVFGGNLSGLDYEGSGSAAPGVLWGARNGPGSLFRLVFDGTNWAPDTANNWGAGKALHYPDGTGDPDSEGVTFVGDSSSGGIYISTERNNLDSGVSRLSVLRFDPSAPGGSLNASNEWNLTSDLPVSGANLGLEAITWIDDSYLVAQNFFDEAKGHTYNPADYPGHGNGLFFVGLESNGMIYTYALDQGGSGYDRIATISSGFATVMDLQFDRDLKDLWAECDNTCNGRTTVLRLDPSTGKFAIALSFERPTGMPNINNEGFAIAPATYCQNDVKPVYWADDSETAGHAIRSGTLPCTALSGVPPAQVPDFPFAAIPAAASAFVLGGWFLMRRRCLVFAQ